MGSKTKRNGEGSLMKRRDGRWMGRYWVTLPDGTRKRQQIIRKDHDEVVRLMREEMTRVDQGLPIYKDRTRTVETMTKYFLETIDPKLVRITTLLNHQDLAHKYIISMLGTIQLSLLKPEHVQRMIDTMVRQGVGLCTVRRTREALSAILREAVKLEYVPRNVARLATLPKREHKEKSVWNSEQVARFLEAIGEHPSYPLFLTMFHYGLRRSEVFGLRWIDIDFSGDEIHIRQQRQRFNGEYHILPPKSKAGIRDLPLIPVLTEKLLVLKKEYDTGNYTDGLVFRNKLGNPVEPRSVSETFHYLSRINGLPRITLHEIRHTVATLLKDQGVNPKDAQVILGHSCISTTLSIYTHTTKQNKAQAIGALSNSIVC